MSPVVVSLQLAFSPSSCQPSQPTVTRCKTTGRSWPQIQHLMALTRKGHLTAPPNVGWHTREDNCTLCNKSTLTKSCQSCYKATSIFYTIFCLLIINVDRLQRRLATNHFYLLWLKRAIWWARPRGSLCPGSYNIKLPVRKWPEKKTRQRQSEPNSGFLFSWPWFDLGWSCLVLIDLGLSWLIMEINFSSISSHILQ